MASKTIIVKNLSLGPNINTIKQLFQMQGSCEIECLENYAIVHYQTEEAAAAVVQKLNNTNLIGLNPSVVSIQFYQGPFSSGLPQTKSNALQSKFMGQNLMNTQNSSPKMQMQVEKDQNTFMGSDLSKMKSSFTGSEPQIMSPEFGSNVQRVSGGGGRGNNEIQMQIENSAKLSQDFYNERFKTMAKEYMQSQPHKSKKHAALTSAYYAGEFSKRIVPVKIYSSYEEFYVDTKSMPKPREIEKSAQIFKDKESKTLIDPGSLSYTELQTELRKRNYKDVKGSKQALMHALQKILSEY